MTPLKYFRHRYHILLYASILFIYGSALFAASDLPIWSQITAFESQALHQIHAAKRGSPEALLKLFLLASGDVRTNNQYLKIKSRLNQFFLNLPADTFNGKSEWEKGYILNKKMHQILFRENELDKSSHYHADQSQLSKIFSTTQYNCISSSLLYLYLAKKINLDVDAVLLPTHSFVQLNLSNGKNIEIETTSSNGFDWIHDRKFYHNLSKNWFSKRGLQPSTYEDYLRRTIIKPSRLAAVNMMTQHTFPERMKFYDRLRLLEFSILIAPEETDNLLSLLYAYNNLYIQLHENKDTFELKNLYDQSYDHIKSLITKYRYNSKISKASQGYLTQAAYSYLKVGELEKSRSIFLFGLNSAREKIKNDEKLNQNYLAIFSGLLKGYLRNGQTNIGNRVINSVNQKINLATGWEKVILWYFSKRMEAYWNKEEWQKITKLYDSFKRFNINLSNAEQFKLNVQSAYLNYALKYERVGNWRKATKIILTCRHKIKNAQKCSQRLTKLQQQHQG